MWQRGRSTLLRWLHLVQIARTLLVLLTARAEPQTLALIRLGGWRPAATLTPGLVKEALAARFRNFEAFRLMPETRRKSGPTRHTGPRRRSLKAAELQLFQAFTIANGSFTRPPMESNVQAD